MSAAEDFPQRARAMFEVRLLPHGLSVFGALPEHYTLVSVRAEHALGARMSGEVERLVKKGLYVVETVQAGQWSATAIQAVQNRERATREAPPADLRGANDAHTPGVPVGSCGV